MPKISILIANYNNGHFFKDAFESLINQTEKDWEAIIIDDCSTDNSVNVIKKMIEDDKRFVFYRNNKNLGYQKTLVKAIELSSSPIFGRLDPDDALSNTAIEKVINAHTNNPEIGLVYSNLHYCDENLNPQKIHQSKQIQYDKSFFILNGEIHSFATFSKEIYLQTEGIDIKNKRSEDKDIYMKMCEKAPVKHIDEALYLYRLHNMGVSTNVNIEKAYFWHWIAIIKAAERRDVNVEELFTNSFVKKYLLEQEKDKIKKLKKSKWLRLGHFLGIFRGYKYL